MKTKTSATFFLLLAFSMGVVAGAIGVYLYQSQVRAAGPRFSPPPGPRDIVEDMSRDLKLDAEQKVKLQEIISQSRERYRTLSKQFQPQYQTIRSETNQAIRQILRDEQRQRFEQTLKEIEARHRDRGPRMPK